MSSEILIQWIAAGVFGLALVHTFSAHLFERLAHRQPRHAGVWHLLGEVEVVFGLWALILIASMALIQGSKPALAYLDSRNFTEPLFVFAILVVAASRPVLYVAGALLRVCARVLPLREAAATYFCLLAVVPLLGSFITEPAAMTLAALMLRDRYFGPNTSMRMRYATLGVLFVNVSIGGTLTHFAAPPVLMVASTWNWDTAFMLREFGWKAAIAVLINATAVTVWLRQELQGAAAAERPSKVPATVIIVHLLFLAGIVVLAHHPAAFMGLFLFFMGYTVAYARHQQPLMLREGLLVGFFLAGLVVLGGQQQWWLSPLLLSLSPEAVYWGAAALTAITDNAALTYLGSLVPGLSPQFQYALVAGAVTGGGLTLIANAPNPAGAALLKDRFENGAISALRLLLAALPPTAVAACAFVWL